MRQYIKLYIGMMMLSVIISATNDVSKFILPTETQIHDIKIQITKNIIETLETILL